VTLPKVTGGDLSMTATGLTFFSRQAGEVQTEVIKPRAIGDQRLTEIAYRVSSQAAGSELVVLEGFINRSLSAGVTGMVQGAVRAALHRDGLKYAVLAPSSLKLYATGKGNASKTDMAVAAFKRFGLEFKDDNACDSYWLWHAGMDVLGVAPVVLPQAQRAALLKMEMNP
jgi:Holliday junction resolvasome RuvABC endonuclease subunit